MFKKESIVYLIASAGFFFAGIFEMIASQLVLGFSFISLGFVMLTLKFSIKKKDIDFTRVEKDEEFLSLVSKGDKIKAIKRCRSITSCGLKEALDYVESII